MRKSYPKTHPVLLTTNNSFNWLLSDAINPLNISVVDQSKEYHLFLKSFTRAKSLTPATPDQYWHLIQNLQRTIQSYDEYVLKLQSDNEILKKKIKKLKIIQKQKINELSIKNNNEKYLCPICLETVSTLVDLDYHISKQHNKSYDKWNSLRCEELKNITSENANKINEDQSSNLNQLNSINELHNWMNNKFDYLENLVVEKRKERKYHHHHKHDSNQNKYNRPNNNSKILYDLNPFHNEKNHISNSPESENEFTFHFNSTNKKDDIEKDHSIKEHDHVKFFKLNNESSASLFNEDQKDTKNENDTGHFVETIENNNNHSIFFSTTSLNKLKTKSEDADN